MPTIQCIATDVVGASGTATAEIEIGDPNIICTSITANPESVEPGGTTIVTVVGSGYIAVVWSYTGGRTGGTFTELDRPERQEFSVPNNLEVDTVITITARLLNADGFGRECSVNLTVINVAPDVGNITQRDGSAFPTSIRIGSSGVAAVSATDRNNDTLTYRWSSDRIVEDTNAINLLPNQYGYMAPSTTSSTTAKTSLRCVVNDNPPPPHLDLSGESSVDVIIEPNLPGAPTVTTSTETDNINGNSITVSWTQPSSGGAEITAYNIQYSIGTTGVWHERSIDAAALADTGLETTFTNLLTGTNYRIRVRATNHFEIDGVSYGGFGNFGTASRTTLGTQVVTIIEDIPDENQRPVVSRVTPTFVTISPSQTTTMVADWIDPDGDLVEIVWYFTPEDGNGAGLIVANPQELTVGSGQTRCQFVPPSNLPTNMQSSWTVLVQVTDDPGGLSGFAVFIIDVLYV